MSENPRIILEKMSFKKKIPKEIRLFLPTENNYIYFNNGGRSLSMTTYGQMSSIKPERGSVLDEFAKFEFITSEMLRFTVVGFEPTDAIMEVIKSLSFKQRINILVTMKKLDGMLAGKIRGIVDIRNSLAHKFKANETIWNNERLFNAQNFDNFKKELQQIWNELISEYNKMISDSDLQTIIQKIDDYNKP